MVLHASPDAFFPQLSEGDRGATESRTELSRLPLALLQLVIKELSEQVKEGPLPQGACDEILRLSCNLNLLADDGCPVRHALTNMEKTDMEKPNLLTDSSLVNAAPEAKQETKQDAEEEVEEIPEYGTEETCKSQTGRSTRLSRRSGTHLDLGETAMATEALLNLFEQLDVDGGGTLSTAELRRALRAGGIPAARAQKILTIIDIDGSGEIDYEEWQDAVEQSEDEHLTKLSADLALSTLAGTRFFSIGEDKPSPLCMLRPDSPWRLAWDLVLALLCIFVALVLPFSLGFEELMSDHLVRQMLHLEFIIDYLFLLDVCLNFRTGTVERDGSVNLDWRCSARAYLTSWFVVDLLSCTPLNEISAGKITSVRVLKLLKIPRILRALRIIKPIIMKRSELVAAIDEALSSPFLRAVRRRGSIVILTLLLLHWLACLMAFCSMAWLDAYLAAKGLETTLWRAYLVATYWAVTTMTTVGWGDITPSTDSERAYTIFAMIIGGLYYGTAIGTVSSIVQHSDLNSGAFHDRMDAVYAWLEHHKLPREMRRRIIRYFKEYLTEQSAVHEAQIVSQLSPSLRNEVGKLVIHEDIQNNPLFDGLPLNAITRLQKILQAFNVEAGQTVVQSGEAGTGMFIVRRGTLKLVFNIDGVELRSRRLFSGDSFGEEILAGLEVRYAYTVIATDHEASLFTIEKDDFQQLFTHMPDVRDQVIENAAASQAVVARSGLRKSASWHSSGSQSTDVCSRQTS